MKHLITLITGICLSGMVTVSYSQTDYYQTYTHHKGKAGKNIGTSGNDAFYLGNVKRAGARPNNGTVTVHARGGDDLVRADYVLLKKNQYKPEKWGAWGCGEMPLCYSTGTIRQGVVAFMGAGNDTFYGSEHGDVAFTGSGGRGDDGHDVLWGFGGDDVLIANGAGKSAALIGGDGDDLLWNRRSTGTVRHGTDSYPDQGTDTVIAGAGTDIIDSPNAGITIIGFDPANDRVKNTFGIGSTESVIRYGSLSATWYETGGLYVNDWKNTVLEMFDDPNLTAQERQDKADTISNQGVSLPNINLLGHSFTLSEDAVDMDKATVFRSDTSLKWRRGEVTVNPADIYSSVVTFVPLKGQEATTELFRFEMLYADNPYINPNYGSE